ncbi:MAG: tetratricopeptide repeat protein [Bacteroidota bacterium]
MIDSEEVYLNKALKISEEINYQRGISTTLGSLGIIAMHKGEYPKALGLYFQGLKIDEEINNTHGILSKVGNIGVIYDYQGEYEKALQYYDKALKLSESLNDRTHMSIQYCNKGIVYCNLGKFEDALISFTKAFKIDSASRNQAGVGRNLSNIGNVYNSLHQPLKALEKHLAALIIADSLEDKSMRTSCLLNVAWIYADLQKNSIAEEYFLKALKLSDEVNDLNLKSEMEISLSEFYEGIGKAQLALLHYKKHISIRDSIYNEDNTKRSIKAELNYEFDKRAAATKFEHDRIVYQLDADNKIQKQWRLFFIVVIVLACAGLFFIKRAYDNKKKLAIFLASEDQRKDILLQEVHHRINNNLQIISSLLTLQANNADNEKLTEYLTQSQNRIQSLSALHELLYDTNSPLEINMDDYINKILNFHRDILQTMNKHILIEVNIANVSFPTKIAVALAMVVNELITNSIKYAFLNQKEGLISVTLTKDQKEDQKNQLWMLIIRDNGKGLAPESERRKDSLGLKLVSIMTRQIGGTLTSKNDLGAVFSIAFNILKTK